MLAEVIPYDPNKVDPLGLPQQRLPLGAVKERDWSYIRRGVQAGELLFHLSLDPAEQRNLADEPSAQAPWSECAEHSINWVKGRSSPSGSGGSAAKKSNGTAV